MDTYHSENFNNYLNSCSLKGQRSALAKGFKLWRSSELVLLEKMFNEGVLITDICNILGRSKGSVLKKLEKIRVKPRFVRYSFSDDAYIKAHYGLHSALEVGEHLNRTAASIRNRAHKLGLGGRRFGSNHHFSSISDHEVELIRQLHEQGISIRSIAEKFEISASHTFDLIHFIARPYPTEDNICHRVS